MRIAFIASEFPKFTETFVAREAMAFVNAGHEVLMVHLKPYRSDELIHDFMRPLLGQTLGRPLNSPKTWGKAAGRALRKPKATLATISSIVSNCISEPDILAKNVAATASALALSSELEAWGADHVHACFAGFTATAAWAIHKNTGIPYSVSCHGHGIFITQALLDEKLGIANPVRVISNFNRDFLKEHIGDLDTSKIQIIRCGVDLDAVELVDPPASARLKILFIGSLQERKGVDVLLNALSKCDAANLDFECTIIGDGPDRSDLETLSRSLGLDGRTVFAGKKTQTETFAALRDHHVLVTPSRPGKRGRAEGIPVVLMEALAHGRPVITTRLTGIPELVEHGVNGWIADPSSVDSLHTQIMDASADRGALKAMGAAGHEKVKMEYDGNANGRQLVDAIEQTLNQAPLRRADNQRKAECLS